MWPLGNTHFLLGEIRRFLNSLLFRGAPVHHRVRFPPVIFLPIGGSGIFFEGTCSVTFSPLALHRPDSAVEISVYSQIFSIYYIRWELLDWPTSAPIRAAISCHNLARFNARQIFLATLLLA